MDQADRESSGTTSILQNAAAKVDVQAELESERSETKKYIRFKRSRSRSSSPSAIERRIEVASSDDPPSKRSRVGGARSEMPESSETVVSVVFDIGIPSPDVDVVCL